jgi:hypothetical protein
VHILVLEFGLDAFIVNIAELTLCIVHISVLGVREEDRLWRVWMIVLILIFLDKHFYLYILNGNVRNNAGIFSSRGRPKWTYIKLFETRPTEFRI